MLGASGSSPVSIVVRSPMNGVPSRKVGVAAAADGEDAELSEAVVSLVLVSLETASPLSELLHPDRTSAAVISDAIPRASVLLLGLIV